MTRDDNLHETAPEKGVPFLNALEVVNRPEADIRQFMTDAYRSSNLVALDMLAALLQQRLDGFAFKHSIQYHQVNTLRERAVAAYKLLKNELDELAELMPDQWADSFIRTILREMDDDPTRDSSDDLIEQTPRFENISVEHLSTLITAASEKMLNTHHFEKQFDDLGTVLQDLQKEISARLNNPALPDSEVGLLLEAKAAVDVSVETYQSIKAEHPDEALGPDLEN